MRSCDAVLHSLRLCSLELRSNDNHYDYDVDDDGDKKARQQGASSPVVTSVPTDSDDVPKDLCTLSPQEP